MKLLKINSKYVYEIESDYKLQDKIIFTDKSTLKGEEGYIVGIVSMEDYTNYLVSYTHKICGGYANSMLIEMPSCSGVFTKDQIKLKESED